MNPWWMAAADLRQTLLSSLGVLVLLALAFSGTILVQLTSRSLVEGGAASAQDFDLVVGAPGSRLDLVLASVFLRTDEVLPLLPATVADRLAADPRVAASSPLIFSDHWDAFPLVGIGPDLPRLRPSLVVAEGRWPQEPFEVIEGAAVGQDLGFAFHGAHGAARQTGTPDEVHPQATYRIVGRLKATGTPWDRSLLTPYQSAWLLHGRPDAEADEVEVLHRVSAVLVKPKDFPAAYSLRAEFREGQTTAAFPAEVLASLFGLVDTGKQALGLVSLLFQALVFAAVLLSLLAGLPAKARWIGLLRALGAGRAYVFLTLWLQTALVFLAAVVLGALAGTAAAGGVTAWIGAQTGLALKVEWRPEDFGVLAAFWGAGLVGALVPAFVGYRTSVRRSLLAS